MPDPSAFGLMIEAAIAAPSPDNNQPCKFRVDGGRLLVYLDRERSLPSDEDSMFDMTAVGAAVENAVIAAAELGLAADVRWCGLATTTSEPVVDISTRPGGTRDPLFDAIHSRCTCRKPYSKRPLEPAQIDALGRACEPFAGVQVDWITAPAVKSRFGSLIASTDSLRFRTRPFHEELFRQLRFRRQEAESTRDGLDVRTLELPPGVTSLLRLLRSWNVMRVVHACRLTPLLTAPSKGAVKNSGGIAIVSVPDRTPETFLTGGRAVQRLWLAATREGLSMHPLGSLPIFLLQSNPRPEFAKTIEIARQAVHEICPNLRGRVIQLAFRVGVSPPPSQRSLRLPPEQVMERANPPNAS